MTGLKISGLTVKDIEPNFNGVKNWHGDIDVSGKNLVSLLGSPETVVGNFSCGRNYLKDFSHAPSNVVGEFIFGGTSVIPNTTLPKKARKMQLFQCNSLMDLAIPRDCEIGSIDIRYCHSLTTVSSLPIRVNRLNLADNVIEHLNNLNTRCGSSTGTAYIKLSNNQLTSLSNIHTCFPEIDGVLQVDANPIKEGWLNVFFIKKLKRVDFGHTAVSPIFNKYLKLGKAGLVKCQIELLNNGLEKYARM